MNKKAQHLAGFKPMISLSLGVCFTAVLQLLPYITICLSLSFLIGWKRAHELEQPIEMLQISFCLIGSKTTLRYFMADFSEQFLLREPKPG